MSDYNPFGKALGQLSAADLSTLRAVHEGWYVEYKSETPNATSLAKSVSAFANTYGGWLFLGVMEKSREDNVAGSFPGIARADVDLSLQRIRQAVAQSINPSPHFDVMVIWGPEPSIGLEIDRAVICMSVPRGSAAPFVHRSGQIYRRVGDGSEPKAETDRFILDHLWQRSRDIEKQYAEWLDRDLELSEQESHSPYLRILLTPDLWRDESLYIDITTKRAREIFADNGPDGSTMWTTPYDTVHRTGSGYIARQLKGNPPGSLTATWFLSANLTSEIVLPLSRISAQVDRVAAALAGYQNAYRYADALRQQGHSNAEIIDLNFVFSSLNGLFHTQSLLDAEASRTGPVHIKAQLINVWRTCPFLDVESVIADQEMNGIPTVMRRTIWAPRGKEPQSFVMIPERLSSPEETPVSRKFYQSMVAFEPIAAAFGIETGLGGEVDADGIPPIIHADLSAATLRATEAQAIRNQQRGNRL